ncbi:MAG: 5-(carboxyamino)imidazole ribonucleotide mutase [Clostridia bacterium]|nr:5-(carboxyamino)imidazole ribonucleotide mutase [Clostridia bacterium]
MGKIAVVLGSKSDFPVVKNCVATLKNFGAEYVVRVISAHRTADEARNFAADARENGIDVIICAAGKAAHLGGFMAAYTTLPIIGLPVKTDMMGGMDSLLSMVQMPSGVPVACVGVNGAENAALYALEIEGITDPKMASRMALYRDAMRDKIAEDDKALQDELYAK